MIWLTLRQHRTEIIIYASIVAVLAVVLVITGIEMRNDFQQLGMGACLANPSSQSDCGLIIGGFDDNYRSLQQLIPWLNLLPVLYGALIGVPLLAREYEQRTQLMAWTQGITRQRWLLSKLGILLVVVLVLAGIQDVLMMWWNGPFDQIDGKFAASSFDFGGIAPLGYALFSFAVGLAAGAFLRRTVPAIAATMLGFIPLRYVVESSLRQNYQAPLTYTDSGTLSDSGPHHYDWIITSGWLDRAGHAVNDFTVFSTCDSGRGTTTKEAFFQCANAHGWLESVIYQPISRYWTFQFIETALFVGLAVVLLGVTIWWVSTHSR